MKVEMKVQMERQVCLGLAHQISVGPGARLNFPSQSPFFFGGLRLGGHADLLPQL